VWTWPRICFLIEAGVLWFRMRHRHRLDILAAVLNAAGDGAKKTRIMRAANLNYKVLGKYLDETVGVGFLRFNDGGYEVTEKGREFLGQYNRFYSRYSTVRNSLESLMSEWQALERMCEKSGKTSGAGWLIDPVHTFYWQNK
jgi:predicted transcriptional regulator